MVRRPPRASSHRHRKDPALHGAFLLPILGAMIHGRCGDAVYPLLRVAHSTGDSKYLRTAILVHDWSERNVSQADGSWINDVILSSWKKASPSSTTIALRRSRSTTMGQFSPSQRGSSGRPVLPPLQSSSIGSSPSKPATSTTRSQPPTPSPSAAWSSTSRTTLVTAPANSPTLPSTASHPPACSTAKATPSKSSAPNTAARSTSATTSKSRCPRWPSMRHSPTTRPS